MFDSFCKRLIKPWTRTTPRVMCYTDVNSLRHRPPTSLAKPCLIKSWHRGSPAGALSYDCRPGPFKARSQEVGYINRHVNAKISQCSKPCQKHRYRNARRMMFARTMSEHISGFEPQHQALRAKHYMFWLVDEPQMSSM